MHKGFSGVPPVCLRCLRLYTLWEPLRTGGFAKVLSPGNRLAAGKSLIVRRFRRSRRFCSLPSGVQERLLSQNRRQAHYRMTI